MPFVSNHPLDLEGELGRGRVDEPGFHGLDREDMFPGREGVDLGRLATGERFAVDLAEEAWTDRVRRKAESHLGCLPGRPHELRRMNVDRRVERGGARLP